MAYAVPSLANIAASIETDPLPAPISHTMLFGANRHFRQRDASALRPA